MTPLATQMHHTRVIAKLIAYVGGPQAEDEGVWVMENFLPPLKVTK